MKTSFDYQSNHFTTLYHNDLPNNEVLGMTNDILRHSNSKIKGKKPPYNETSNLATYNNFANVLLVPWPEVRHIKVSSILLVDKHSLCIHSKRENVVLYILTFFFLPETIITKIDHSHQSLYHAIANRICQENQSNQSKKPLARK